MNTLPTPLHDALVDPRPSHDPTAAVLIAGGTGFVGRGLVAALQAQGRRVMVLTRDARRAHLLLGPGVTCVERLEDLPAETCIDSIVNLAGARVLGMPWTAGRRQVLRESRTGTAAALLALMQRLQNRPRVLVAASAVGYYGVPAEGVICGESTPPMPGVFQSDLCLAIEREAGRAEALGVRVVCLRLGVVLGRDGGAYPPQSLAARLGLAARIGSGRQPAPWIHRDDAVGMLAWALEVEGLQGAVNAVAPELVDQASFVRSLAASLGRRAWLQVPAAVLRLALGEMATLLADGQAVQPQVALARGYRFRHPTLAAALKDLAGR